MFLMNEKRFTSNGRWIAEGTIVDICDNGKVIMQVFDNDNIQNVVDLLNSQNEKIKELEEKKIELMECNAHQYHEIQNREAENKVLVRIIFLYEKGITMLLSKEEQMKISNYVDLELMRSNDND